MATHKIYYINEDDLTFTDADHKYPDLSNQINITDLVKRLLFAGIPQVQRGSVPTSAFFRLDGNDIQVFLFNRGSEDDLTIDQLFDIWDKDLNHNIAYLLFDPFHKDLVVDSVY